MNHGCAHDTILRARADGVDAARRIKIVREQADFVGVQFFGKLAGIAAIDKKRENRDMLAQLNKVYEAPASDEEEKVSAHMRSKHKKVVEREPW